MRAPGSVILWHLNTTGRRTQYSGQGKIRGMSTDRAAAPRPPLDLADLSGSLVTPGGLWHAVTVVESTGSTNADLLAQAAGGAPEGTVLVADTQTATSTVPSG